MNIEAVKEQAHALFESAPFMAHINDERDYEQALALMDNLIEDYDANLGLIEVLSVSISRWEDSAVEFSDFNKAIEALDSGVAVLNVLKDQHGLNNTDFQAEIGNKSMVSMILNGSRKLSLDHIKKLSARFNVPAKLFV